LILESLIGIFSDLNFPFLYFLEAINCRDNGDGTCSVCFLPVEVGNYSINITFNDHHIPGSPFQTIIYPEPNLEKTIIKGVGIQPHGNLLVSIVDA
jgi:filamin